MKNINEKQIGGDHYKRLGYQPWDFIPDNGIDFLLGSAIAYIARWRHKNGIQDLEKALHFIDKADEKRVKQLAVNPIALAQFCDQFELDDQNIIRDICLNELNNAYIAINQLIQDHHGKYTKG